MKILAFGASNSENSINKSLARFTATLVQDADIETLDLNDYELPIFSEDLEKEIERPKAAREFFEKIGSADAVIVSFAEHNRSYCAAYKNLFDWASRIDQKVFQGKPAIFLSTSPGSGGAGSVLASAKGSVKFFGADLKAAVSVASFHDVFDAESGQIIEPNTMTSLATAAKSLVLQKVAELKAS